jgi:endonuclease YncB( thermonuclease family)
LVAGFKCVVEVAVLRWGLVSSARVPKLSEDGGVRKGSEPFGSVNTLFCVLVFTFLQVYGKSYTLKMPVRNGRQAVVFFGISISYRIASGCVFLRKYYDEKHTADMVVSRNKLLVGGFVAIVFIAMLSGTGDTPASEPTSPKHTVEKTRKEEVRNNDQQLVASAITPRVLGEQQTTGASTPSGDGSSQVVLEESTDTTEEVIYYPVVKVIDGDTLSIDKDGENTTLRLIGLDTPETVHPSKPMECFGKEASEIAKTLLSGKKVRIETDSSQGLFDKYGRLLVYVFLPDGTNFNKYMIEEGFGYEYTYRLPYKYQAEFKVAEHGARENQRGLWAPDVCDSSEEGASVVPTQPTKKVMRATSSGGFLCSYNAYNCKNFKTQAEAQAVFDGCRGVNHDVHKLDRDKDGVVCESLPR